MKQFANFYVLGLIIVLSVLLLPGEVLSQQTWARTYGGVNFDSAQSVQQTTDGGYIVAGYSFSLGAGGYDAWVLKLDSSGAIVWEKTYGGGYHDQGYSIKQTADGGYVVTGYTYCFGAGYTDLWVLKLDASGSITWEKTYGGINNDIGFSIQQTFDGGYIIAGYTESFGAGSADMWVLKLDSTGAVAWQKTFGGSGYDTGTSIQQTTDGGYVVAGRTQSFGGGNGDFWILKLDSSGGVTWENTYGGSNIDLDPSIQQTSDGGYIVAGIAESFGAGNYDMWVLKLDSNGAITWQKTYGGSNPDMGFSVQQTSDGGYIVSGTLNLITYNYDIWVLKLDSDGTITWQKTYGGSSEEYGYSIQQTFDGGYIVAGYTNSFGAGGDDFLVLKLDTDGNIDSSCAFINSSACTTSNSTASANSSSASTAVPSVSVSDSTATTTDSSCTSSLLCNNTIALLSHKPAIDDSAGPIPNGIIEPDEAVDLTGNIENLGTATATSVSGHLSSLDPIQITNSLVSYPDVAAGTSEDSSQNYCINAPLTNRPATHWDFMVTEEPDCTDCNTWAYDFTYHVGDSFSDLTPSYLFYSFIETLLHSGVTAGCTAADYCPEMNVTREQMAKFVCVAMEKKAPGSCTTSNCTGIFADVPGSNIFCPFIEALYNAGIVSGCQASPLMYCPDDIMQRQAMAKFICLAMEATEAGSCPTAPCAEIFDDVPAGNIFCSHIEGVYNAGVVSGCQATPLLYCPSANVTRAQMAKFIINAFDFIL